MRSLASLSAAGVATLVALDVALVYLAVDHTRGEPAGSVTPIELPTVATSAPPGEPTEDGPTEDGPTEDGPTEDGRTEDGRTEDQPTEDQPTEDQPTEDQPADPSDPPDDAFATGPLLVDSSADGAVVREARGDCSGEAAEDAAVQVSTDGGRSFTDAGIADVEEVLRVSADSSSDLLVVAVGRDCRPAAYTSTDGGRTWDESGGAGPYWQLDAEDDDAVPSPFGRAADPGCAVLTLSPLTESGARVLCTTGELRGTANAGASWVLLGTLPGAVGVYYVDETDGYAIGETEDCPAVVSATADGGSGWDELACLDGEEPQAITAAGSTVTALVDSTVRLSTDGGQTWTQP